MARNFDGNDYISLPNEIIVNINEYTVVAWFKTTDTGTGNIIYGETLISSGTARMFLSCEGNSGFEFSHRDNSGNETSIFTATQYNDGVWHQAVAIRKAVNSWELYIDGGLIGTDSTNVGTTTVDRFEIGARRSIADAFFTGQIAEVAIWNVDLFVTEALSLKAGFSPLFIRPQNLINYWPLIRGLNDRIGGLNGTASGTTVFAHPRVIYPSKIWTPSGVAAAPPAANPWNYYAQSA